MGPISTTNKTASTERASLAHLATLELIKLVAPIRSLPSSSRSIFTNWATTYSCQTLSLFRPRTVDEVRYVVELARREGVELRASGSGHSPSDLVCTEGYIINLDRLDTVLEIDTTNTKFHAEGGIKLSALHPILREHDLAISSLGSISDQTLAGCLSTATHGSGVNYGNLSSCVEFFELVLPTPGAPLVRVSKDHDSDLFYAAACGLGLVGVIVGVCMRCERAFNLEEELWTISFADFVERWQEIAESAEHVRCWWFPQVGQVKVSRLNRTDKVGYQGPLVPTLTALPSRFKTYWFDVVLAKHFHAVVLAIARFFPNILPYHANVMWALVHRPAPLRIADLLRPVWPTVASSYETTTTRPTFILDEKESSHPTVEVAPLPSPPLSDAGEVPLTKNILLPLLTTPTYRVASSVEVFNYDCGFPQYTYEGAVPYFETGKCLESLSTFHLEQLYDPKGLRSHFPIEIRYTAADEVWLSPTYGQRATYIGAIQYRPFNLPVPYKKLFKAFENILLQHGGRPHWAKSHTVGTRGLEKLYPKLGDFLNVRERVDPKGVLLNAYTRRHLLGQVGEEVDFKKFKKSGR
ncbi:BQ5605_C006g04042 [Microbotryum silenes-dioicae]|uniref:D-arabinono-1,4-lactone oxidase n=1 Tax=Microbotryum silenes-dioicae TaxID=796604 RepID=A0A2X0P869_9BASI|nr:BQ5605_C006g04042 [Microbotryum silenes-dioicae]